MLGGQGSCFGLDAVSSSQRFMKESLVPRVVMLEDGGTFKRQDWMNGGQLGSSQGKSNSHLLSACYEISSAPTPAFVTSPALGIPNSCLVLGFQSHKL